jgi:hypothetical protein
MPKAEGGRTKHNSTRKSKKTHTMRGEKKITKTMKKRWARYALPAGFAKRGYPKDSSCRTIKKSMMGRKNPLYGY